MAEMRADFLDELGKTRSSIMGRIGGRPRRGCTAFADHDETEMSAITRRL